MERGEWRLAKCPGERKSETKRQSATEQLKRRASDLQANNLRAIRENSGIFQLNEQVLQTPLQFGVPLQLRLFKLI